MKPATDKRIHEPVPEELIEVHYGNLPPEIQKTLVAILNLADDASKRAMNLISSTGLEHASATSTLGKALAAADVRSFRLGNRKQTILRNDARSISLKTESRKGSGLLRSTVTNELLNIHDGDYSLARTQYKKPGLLGRNNGLQSLEVNFTNQKPEDPLDIAHAHISPRVYHFGNSQAKISENDWEVSCDGERIIAENGRHKLEVESPHGLTLENLLENFHARMLGAQDGKYLTF